MTPSSRKSDGPAGNTNDSGPLCSCRIDPNDRIRSIVGKPNGPATCGDREGTGADGIFDVLRRARAWVEPRQGPAQHPYGITCDRQAMNKGHRRRWDARRLAACACIQADDLAGAHPDPGRAEPHRERSRSVAL
jgi:hypothetical protein